MTPKFKQLIDTLAAPTLLGHGEADPRKRRTIANLALDISLGISPENKFVDPVILTYLEKVTRSPRSINDRDIELVTMVGYSLDDLFEVMLGVAIAAGLALQVDDLATEDMATAEWSAADMAPAYA